MTAPTLLVARDTVTRWEQGLRDLLPSLTDLSRDVVTIVADQMRNRVRLCEFDPQFERMELVRFDGGVREAARRSPQSARWACPVRDRDCQLHRCSTSGRRRSRRVGGR